MLLQRKYWISLAIITALLVLGALLAGTVQSFWKAQPALAAGNTEQRNTITVSGTGQVEVQPDVAYISVGVMTRAATANEAQQDNAKIITEVEKTLLNTFKLDKKDIKTVRFDVQPEYRYAEKEEPKVTGYSATHMIQISYRNLDGIGAVLDAVSKAGVNQINNIQFASEKLDTYELDALKDAMANARQKAEVLAAAENKSIKSVANIAQASSNGGPIFGDSISGAAFKEMAFAADQASTSISSGQITVRTQVTVQYEF